MRSPGKRTVIGVAAGHAAFEALKGDSAGEVHGVFERSFNILVKSRLVGVVRGDVPVGPIDLVTSVPPAETMPGLGVKKGLRVRISGDRVLVGDALEISLDGVELWRPPTRVEKPLGRERARRNLEAVKKRAVGRAGSRGLGPLLSRLDSIVKLEAPERKGLNDVADAALPRLLSLLKSVKADDSEGVKKASRNLVGLGIGLTPSADDMLAGLTSTLWWTSKSFGKGVDFVEEINAAILSQAGATNLLSRQLLEHAARGEVNGHLVGLFQEVLAGTGKSLGELVDRVMEIGETSGEDLMVGFILGMEIGLEKF